MESKTSVDDWTQLKVKTVHGTRETGICSETLKYKLQTPRYLPGTAQNYITEIHNRDVTKYMRHGQTIILYIGHSETFETKPSI